MARKSSWLVTRQEQDPSTEPCKTCDGEGTTGQQNAKGEWIPCPDCGGFGY